MEVVVLESMLVEPPKKFGSNHQPPEYRTLALSTFWHEVG